MRLTVGDIGAATGGRVVGNAHAVVDGVSIDSRSLEPGALFVAVRAIRDGHDFVADAFAAGAAAAVVSVPPDAPGFTGVVVRDTMVALSALGALARDRLGDALVVAVTGSTGKTSTKDLLVGTLGARFTVSASPGSYNNELGVPLTLLNAGADAQAVVVEIGARGRGHIAAQGSVVRHRVGIVTTVGAAHTEMFGSLEATAEAKSELVETLPADGVAVVGIDHEWADFVIRRSAAPVITVGRAAHADVRVSGLSVDAGLRPSFELHTPWGHARLRLEVRGGHQADNAALAVAAAVAGGVPLADAAGGAERATGSRWRMEVERTPLGVTVLNDAYNANPASTAAALDALASFEAPGRRWAVLGEMAELGEISAEEHARVGRLAAELGVDRVVAVGAPARAIAAEAAAGGCAVDEVADADAAATLVAAAAEPGDVVLVKGSRVAGLETVADRLAHAREAGPA